MATTNNSQTSRIVLRIEQATSLEQEPEVWLDLLSMHHSFFISRMLNVPRRPHVVP